MSWVLAIDFGTSNTTAAYADDSGAPVVLELEGSRYLPSVVVAEPDGSFLTGKAAVRQAIVYPERTERVPKRALVSGGDVLLGQDEPVEAALVAAAVLRTVYDEALRLHGGDRRPVGGDLPRAVVLTHPARWGQETLERLREAAGLAGIHQWQVVLLSEPEAAAWFYAPPAVGQVVAVFDLGGGTLDTAVLTASDDGFALAGPPGGDPELGGEDFDEALLAWVAERAAERDPVAWDELSGSGRQAARNRARLRAEVTVAKEALSSSMSYAVVVDEFDEEFRVTRDDFDKLIEDTVALAVEELRRTIAAAGVAADRLAGLYLTGGSSRVPLVATQLWDALGIEPQLRDDPKAVVVLGALRAYAAEGTGRHGHSQVTGASPAAGAVTGGSLTAASASVPAATAPAANASRSPAPAAAEVRLASSAAPVALTCSRVFNGKTWQGTGGTIRSRFARIAWSPDGAHLGILATGLEIWSVAEGRKVSGPRVWPPAGAFAWSPGGDRLATGQADTGIDTGKVKVWTLNGATRRFEFGVYDAGRIRSVAWSGRGDLIAVARYDGGYVGVFNVNGAKQGGFHPSPGRPVPGVTPDLLDSWDPPLAWCPRPGSDGELLAFATRDGVIHGLVLAGVTGPDRHAELLRLKDDLPTGLAWSPDGSELAVCGGRRLVLWRRETGATRELARASAGAGGADWAQWTGDGRYLVGFHRERTRTATQVVGVTLWDAVTGAEVRTWYRPATGGAELERGTAAPAAFDPCHGIALSPSGARLARFWHNRPVELWDISGI